MKLRTIGLISTLALGLLAGPLPAKAQQTGKVYRIGYLTSRPGLPATNSTYIALLQRLRELGYVEGQNLVPEYRSGKRKHRPKMAADLVRLKVDVIVVSCRIALFSRPRPRRRGSPLCGVHSPRGGDVTIQIYRSFSQNPSQNLRVDSVEGWWENLVT